MIVECLTQYRRGRSFADRTVGTKHSDDRTRYLGDITREQVQVSLSRRSAHVENLDIAHLTGCFEYRIVTQKFVKAIDDVHSTANRLKHQPPLIR